MSGETPTTVDDVDIGSPPAVSDPEPMHSRRREFLVVVSLYVASIVFALVISAVLVAATGGSWRAVFSAMLDGSLRAPGRWGTTIGVAIPLLVVALGTTISGRAGLVNIGQEGQVLIGAAFAAYIGVRVGGPGPIVLLCLLVGGAIGGAIWSGIAGALRYWRGVPEVLTTLLLVTVAFQATGYGLKNEDLLLAPFRGDRSVRNPVSEQLSETERIPRINIFGNEFPISAFAAVLMAFALVFLFRRTLWGFRLRMFGQNARTARRAGVSNVKYGMGTMLLSGGCAGLAGGMMLSGGDFGDYKFTPGLSNGIGWDGLLVALVARERPVLIIPMAFGFAGLRTGSGFLAATGVERQISSVVQALLVLALLIPPAILFIRSRRRALAATRART